jgi:LPS sulfotransferase NodH
VDPLSRLLARRFESRTIWILGSPRSGSTWLWEMLRRPGIVGMNEPLIGWHLGPFMADHPAIDPGDLDVANCTLQRMEAKRDASFFSERHRQTWQPVLRRLLAERLYEQVRQVRGRRRASSSWLVVKEPHGSQAADLILGAQPRARLLFLLRDGRDVVDSELAANLAGSWVTTAFPAAGVRPQDRLAFVVQSAHKWVWRTRIVQQAYDAHRGPKLLVRYEELRADPGAGVRQIFDWIGIRVAPRELEAIVQRHAFEAIPESDRGEGQFRRAAAPGHWTTSLTAEEQTAMLEILTPTLTEFGYAV